MNKLEKWKELSTQLPILRKEEMELRVEISEDVIGSSPMENSTVTVRESVHGYPCKATQAMSFSLDLGVLATIWDALSPAEQRVVKMKPTLQTGPYKKLPEDSLLHEAVVSKLAAPKLEIGEYVG